MPEQIYHMLLNTANILFLRGKKCQLISIEERKPPLTDRANKIHLIQPTLPSSKYKQTWKIIYIQAYETICILLKHKNKWLSELVIVWINSHVMIWQLNYPFNIITNLKYLIVKQFTFNTKRYISFKCQ